MSDREHLSGTEARAGEKKNSVRYILGLSLAAIIILFAILLLVYQ